MGQLFLKTIDRVVTFTWAHDLYFEASNAGTSLTGGIQPASNFGTALNPAKLGTYALAHGWGIKYMMLYFNHGCTTFFAFGCVGLIIVALLTIAYASVRWV